MFRPLSLGINQAPFLASPLIASAHLRFVASFFSVPNISLHELLSASYALCFCLRETSLDWLLILTCREKEKERDNWIGRWRGNEESSPSLRGLSRSPSETNEIEIHISISTKDSFL